ncbi:transcription factor TGA7-like isoform X2 [Andrographis paniculata]|nr:transcription factor TGA7-like isoform X2 [Andrographis paniculata]
MDTCDDATAMCAGGKLCLPEMVVQIDDKLYNQGLLVDPVGATNPGISTFEEEYKYWMEELYRQISDLKNILRSPAGDSELRVLVNQGVRHYINLFEIKAKVARADVLYLISGTWTSPARRFFLWIGGCRPSELINVLMPELEPMPEEQRSTIINLRHICQQAEDALSQGLDKLQLILAEAIVATTCADENQNRLPQLGGAPARLDALAKFVGQADHLRKETLQQMARLLTARQAARGLLALDKYLRELENLSPAWSSLHETAGDLRQSGDARIV